MIEQTLLIIKPDAYKRRLVGKIISIVEREGFELKDIILKKLTQEEAEKLYNVHRGKDFFEPLVFFMMEAPIIALVLEGDDAILRLRNIVGDTDPKKSKQGTIRALFGTNTLRNAVHASDSEASFIKEVRVFSPNNYLFSDK